MITSTAPSPIINIKIHLLMTAAMGTAKHLREAHQLPEALIDAEDTYGLGADHAWLHGWKANADGSLTRREST